MPYVLIACVFQDSDTVSLRSVLVGFNQIHLIPVQYFPGPTEPELSRLEEPFISQSSDVVLIACIFQYNGVVKNPSFLNHTKPRVLMHLSV